MNERVKRLTEIFGWLLFVSVYTMLIFLVFVVLQTPGPSGWWMKQTLIMQVFVCILGFIAWCVYTIVMFLAFWLFNAMWLWFTRKIVKAKCEIDAIKKKMSDESLKKDSDD